MIGLIQVKEADGRGVSKGWQGCSEGFPEGKARAISRGAALLARGYPVHSDSFTLIYILFKIGHVCDVSDLFKY